MTERCTWCGNDPSYMKCHDEEWGVPVHDDRKHFEFLVLEGAQAGLSWITIPRRREGYRKAFAGFDPAEVAKFDEDRIAVLLQDEGIIRNRQKVRSAVKNALAFLDVQMEFGSFDRYIWSFLSGQPIANQFEKDSGIPAKTSLSERISKDLKKRGFPFVGPTIIYAHMQAIGMVNDHLVFCYRYRELT